MEPSSNVQMDHNIPIEYGSFQFTTKFQVKEGMEKRIKDVQSMLKFENTMERGKIRVILQAYKWDMRKVENVVRGAIRNGSLAAVQAKVGLLDKEKLRSDQFYSWTKAEYERGDTCMCCTATREEKPLKGIVCGDVACGDCWKGHFNKQIEENARSLKCIACKLVVYDEKVKEFYAMTEKQAYTAFESWKLYNYAVANRLIKCPHDKCNFYLRVTWPTDEGVDCRPHMVTCRCKHQFIANACCPTWHAPLPCALWKAWLQHKHDDQFAPPQSYKEWMKRNAKPCPFCSRDIEKDGGCLLIFCKCGNLFCWSCRKEWDEKHVNFYACPRTPGRLENPVFKKKEIFHGTAYTGTYNYYKECQKAEDSALEYRDIAWKNEKMLRAYDFLFNAEGSILLDAVDTWLKWTNASMYLHLFYFFLKRSGTGSMFKLEVDKFREKLQNLEKLLRTYLGEPARIVKSHLKDYKGNIQKTIADLKTKHEKLMKDAVSYVDNGTFRFVTED